jgi:opine dehydrogenase
VKITVLGGGNGAYAAAAHLSLEGNEVVVYSPFHEELKPIEDRGGIRLKGCLGDIFVKGMKVAKGLTDALRGSEIVMVAVPATAHTYYGNELASLLSGDQLLFLNPGHSGGALNVKQIFRELDVKTSVKIAETNTLTYIARKTDVGEVTIYKLASNIIMSTLPATDSSAVLKLLRGLYPGIRQAENVLETSLTNLNAVLHPPGMILNAGMIEKTRGDFFFYSEGTTPAVGAVMQRLDSERMKILRACGLPDTSFLDHFHSGGYTTEEAYKTGSYYRVVSESPPNQKIRSPQDLKHRFMEEDISCGLVPISEMGRLFGVQAPLIDSLIELASTINNKDYRKEGLNLAKLGLKGMTAEQVQKYVNQGKYK